MHSISKEFKISSTLDYFGLVVLVALTPNHSETQNHSMEHCIHLVLCVKKIRVETHTYSPRTKINLKRIKDLRPEIIKILEENIGKKLLNIGLGNHFFGYNTKNTAMKAKINKWKYIKLKLLHS